MTNSISLSLTHPQTVVIVSTLLIGLLTAIVAAALWVQPTKQKETHSLNWIKFYSLLLAPIWLFFLCATIFILWQLLTQFDPTLTTNDLRWQALAFVGMLTAFGGLASAPLALVRVWATERQTRTAEQSHVTDRIAKAVEQIGAEKTIRRQRRNSEGKLQYEFNDSDEPDYKKPIFEELTIPNIEVRIGGLLSLERIAQDSVLNDGGRDHVRAMKIICAYIRNNAPVHDAGTIAKDRFVRMRNNHVVSKQDDTPFSADDRVHTEVWNLPRPRPDIQFALEIIGKRTRAQRHVEIAANYAMDLSRCNLQRADLTGLNFSKASLFETRLDGAFLQNADFDHGNLRGAVLTKANLKNTSFSHSRLASTDFSYALLENITFKGNEFSFTYFTEAQLDNVTFDLNLPSNAVNRIWLERPNLLSLKLSGKICGSMNTLINPPIKDIEPKHSSVVFRNAEVEAYVIGQFDAYRTFGDGSVTVINGERPAHWRDDVLSDAAFEAAVVGWKTSRPST
ncbi:pentapeptide repeat-containing protein [Epibacterium ulvae]|uniref:pentapeptide repeat-containing protein n=1 Tax=Epibacterium ulvae TaxID=1156985 RepID=UPI0024934E33|nr:pentapeptide repeat-containing protein [Epibacterium ulvae]